MQWHNKLDDCIFLLRHFMIAKDSYLMQFVREFTYANQGKAFYTGLQGLGEMIFEDYETNRKKRIG